MIKVLVENQGVITKSLAKDLKVSCKSKNFSWRKKNSRKLEHIPLAVGVGT